MIITTEGSQRTLAARTAIGTTNQTDMGDTMTDPGMEVIRTGKILPKIR